MTKLITLLAALVALSVPALASASPGAWTDKNNADATVCSTYGRDGTQAIVKPTPGVDSSCAKDGDAPTVQIDSPADGSVYPVDQSVTADFSCADAQALKSCQAAQCPVVDGVVDKDHCIAIADGGALDTSTVGSYIFSVLATDTHGGSSVVNSHFTVSAGGSNGGDRDGDGVPDADDRCPDVPAATADGCPLGDSSGSTGSSGISGSDTAGSGLDSSEASTGEQLVLGARLAGCNVVLKVKHRQRSLRKKGLAVTIRSDRACTVKLSGKLIPAKRKGAHKTKVRTNTLTLKLKPQKSTAIKLHFTKKGLRYLKRSLKGKVTRARIFVTDGADVGKKLNRSFTVRIKR